MLPIQFNCVTDEKVHVTILGQHKHYFTGETLYRIREEGECGWIYEEYCSERKLQNLLALRVQEVNE